MGEISLWLRRVFASEIAMCCWLAHGEDWKFVRTEIDSDIGEYYCLVCETTRYKRVWL